jgi:lysophospholipase L1-like esterase
MSSGNGRKIVFSSVITIFLIVISLGVIEIFFRSLKPSLSYRKWHERSLTYLLDDEVDWKLEPRSYTWGQVNQNNFRGKEIPMQRTKGVCRIAIIGGSAAFDLYKRDNETWPAQLESGLNDAKLRVEVLNAGTPGYSTWQAYRQMKSKLIRWKPDLVLLYELFNDSLYFGHNDRQKIIEGWKRNARANYIGWLAHPNAFLDFSSICLPHTSDFVRMYGVMIQMRRSAEDNAHFWQNRQLNWKLQPVGIAFYEENRRKLARFLSKEGSIPLGIVSQASLIRETNTTEESARILYVYRGMNHDELWKSYLAARRIDDAVARSESNVFLIAAHTKIPSSLEYFIDEVHLNDRGSALLVSIIKEVLLDRQQNAKTTWCKP